MRQIAVTGAASGLGAAVRRRLEAAGDRVVGIDLSGSDIDADLATGDGRAHAVAAISDATDKRLDGLVVAAGLGPPSDPVLMTSVNFFGAVVLLDALTGLLAANAPASVVAISSNSIALIPENTAFIDALLAGDEPGARGLAAGLDSATVYGNTKRGLARAIRSRAGDLGEKGVRCNAVAPGPFASPLLQRTLDDPVLGGTVDLLPQPRAGRATADEVAATVAFLLSTDAANVHGSILFVDGGMDAAVSPNRVP
jgi:NAD(P)-dependent dehydrogenase (short-subunit alcohol dehydrogenase family)